MQIGIERARDIVLARLATQQVSDIDTRTLKEELLEPLTNQMNTAFAEVEALTPVEASFIERQLMREVESIELVDEEDLIDALVDTNMPVGLSEDERNRNILTAYDRFARDNANLLTQPVQDAQTLGGDPILAAGSVTALAAGLLRIRAQSLSKTSVTHAANTSRDTVYKANKNVIQEVEWVSVLDSNTTPYCRSQAGKKWPVGQGPRPPAHYNCRSITKPVIKDE